MAVDMFLKLDGVDGESVDIKYQKWIECLSFSWGISDGSKPTNAPGKAPSARRAQVSDSVDHQVPRHGVAQAVREVLRG